MSTFELIASHKGVGLREPSGQKGLGSAILLRNARWFTKGRWIVVSVFAVTGLAGNFMPCVFESLGLAPPSRWPWILACVLGLSNIIFSALVGRLKEDTPLAVVRANIWFQIVVDLMVVTALVHAIGSTDTFISFAYLFHIVLACIFFPPRHSLLVTLLAIGLYFLCVVLELSNIWPCYGIFAGTPHAHWQSNSMSVIFAVSAVLVWLVVWYLVSTLSAIILERDHQLNLANEQLIKADMEKTKLVLQTTHELKAPFSGIETNIQVLRLQHWDEVPAFVKDIIERIEVRAQTLSKRIKDILILGELRSPTARERPPVPIDLKSLIDDVLESLSGKADERRIFFDIRIPAITILGNAEQLAILFSNLVANAIFYSHEGGKVEVSAKEYAGGISVFISDYGIGISDEALPHIFDEYFRTSRAAKFNKLSTGLGLAIVREIAQNLGLRIRVASEQEKGTTFEVAIPIREE